MRYAFPTVVVALIIAASAGATCPADLDMTGDVGTADLLQLLSAWGPCECQEDLDASGAVDVSDLLLLLSAWGPCPKRTVGACCLDAGCAEITSAECADLGGVFLGGDTTCPPGACGAGVVGACCTPNGTCVEIDIPACAAQGGIFQGPGVECTPDLCP